MHFLRNASLCLMLGLLMSCGGSGPPQDAMLASVTISSPTPGPTPFIARIGIRIERADRVRSVSYTIAPRPGTVSRPVSVTYRNAYLIRRQLLDVANHRLEVPVFGLYAGYQNRVTLHIRFADGSTRTENAIVDTPAYQEAVPRYTALDVKTRRQSGIAPGYDFVLLKNLLTTPVVIDTDGNIRWVGSGLSDIVSSTFQGGRFLSGHGTSPVLYRIELDGMTSAVNLSDPAYADFHHDLTPGKTGLLAEVDTLVGGVRMPETVLAEIDADGHVLKQWDMAAIFRAAMIAGGDDPSGFVRDGADWFHMNSAIYSPADDTLIVSSREHFVVKLDYASGRIRWLFGDPGKYWYVRYPSLRALALTLTSGNVPVGQHALSIASDGTLMLFNNGTASFNVPPGAPAGVDLGFSAVSRYAIDEAARTATQVWTYEHNRHIWSDVCSSAYQTSQGGYLIAYSVAYGRTRAKLVGLDADGNVAFDYEYPTYGCDAVFNAVPIDFGALVLD
jgi:arylsulfate sulfotransferase